MPANKPLVSPLVTESVKFENGDRMPRIGFGTWQASDEVLEKAVEAALEAGYRHFDSARAYENEAALGRALRQWIGDDPDRRKQLFVVTKLPPGGNRPELVREYLSSSLQDLGLDYVDLYLIHTPFAFDHVPGDLHPKNEDGTMKVDHSTDLIAVWKEFIKMRECGLARHVGVCNMNESQISRLAEVDTPECVQVETHLLCQQASLRAACSRMNVPLVAYSPLGSKGLADMLAAKNGRQYPDLLQLPEVLRIAAARQRTPAQVLLRFLLQLGVTVIPKSTNPQRIKQNKELFDFELSSQDMQDLKALDRNEEGRICDFTFFPGVEKHPEFPFKKQ